MKFLEARSEYDMKAKIEARINDGLSIERLVLRLTHGRSETEEGGADDFTL